VESILKDLRYGVRMLVKTPVFSLIAVLTLGLGIGANTAIFTLINSVLLRPLPVDDAQGLVMVGDPGRGATGLSFGSPRVDMFSHPQFRLFRDATHDVFSEIYAAGRATRVNIAGEDGAAIGNPGAGIVVTGNYFAVLRAKPVLGRVFTQEDDKAPGSAPMAVLSYAAWKTRFNLDPSIVGRTLRLNGYPFTVIGVMGPEFFGDTLAARPDVWVPMCMQSQIMPGRQWLDDPRASWLHSMGRLQPGVTMAHARDASKAAMAALANANWGNKFQPGELKNFSQDLHVGPGAKGFSGMRSVLGTPLLILMGMVGLVLLIACVNLASLLLARSATRRREMAVRLAIGASPMRVIRQLLTESLVLAIAGGAAGLMFANWGTHALTKLGGDTSFSRIAVDPDWRVLLFTGAACILTGVLFGLAPAMQAARLDVGSALKEGLRTTNASAGSRWNLGRVLVSGEVALSVLVIFAAGLLIRTLQNLENVSLGFDRARIVVVSVDPVAGGYSELQPNLQITTRLQEAVATVAGVSAVTGSENGLFSGTESGESIVIQGYTPQKSADSDANEDRVGAGYFTALQVPMLLGRDIQSSDTETSPRVAVINQAMAKFYFGGQNPIGKTIAIDDPKQKDKPYTIVGVARDVRDHDLRDDIPRRFYIPVRQSPEPMSTWRLEVRTLADAAAVTKSIREAIAAVDRNIPIIDVSTVTQSVDDSLLAERTVSNLSAFFGGLVLLLASIGLYGITAYTVAGRTREIGVRMALGAQRSNVLWMVLREALILVAAGVAAGVPAALAIGSGMKSMLFGLRPIDPVALAATIAVLAVVGGLAAFLPARRATKVDPMQALRYE
jgi:predicted permease